MSELDESSTETNDLAFFAIDHAIDALRSGDGQLTTFAVTEDAAGRNVVRFDDSDQEAALDDAHTYLRHLAPPFLRCAVAWEGSLTVDEDRSDAVLVRAYEPGRPASLQFAQRYAKDDGVLGAVGNPAYVGDGPALS